MRILLFDWSSYGREYLFSALVELGHDVERIIFDAEKDDKDEEYQKKAIKLLSYGYYDLVFGSNYFPLVATACHENGIPYVSWLYDSPLTRIWHESVYYPENTIFSFDQGLCNALKKHGVERIFYMPLAANAKEEDEFELDEEEKEKYSSDISFVGSLYKDGQEVDEAIEKNNLDFLKGYNDAIINAQCEIAGYNFLEEMSEVENMKTIVEALLPEMVEGYFSSPTMIYANYYLAKKVTHKERCKVLKAVSEKFNMDIYTKDDTSMLSKIVNKGTVGYYDKMPLVFHYSKINLNITLRSIQTGIPLRCWDIMAAGGFLLTNYQEDFLKHFEPGVDFVYYLNEEDLLEKVEYYLTHEEERKRIARNGYEKVKKYHSYKTTIEKMLKIAVEGDCRV